MWERIDIEEKYKGLVIGKHQAKLREISNRTRAKVICKGEDVYIILGNEEQRMHAKVQIGEIVVSIPLLLSLISKFRPFGYPRQNILLFLFINQQLFYINYIWQWQ